MPPTPDPGFTLLFDGEDTSRWRMSTLRNQPNADPGAFVVVDGALEAAPGTDIGLLWHTEPTPADFVLRLEWRCRRQDDNSGVFLRFPHPDGRGYDNTAYVAVHFGLEVQIDQLARPDGAAIHGTGAIYALAAPLRPAPLTAIGRWNHLKIEVRGQRYRVSINSVPVTDFTFQPGSDPAHPDRCLPSTAGDPRFVGLQTHTGRPAFRRIQLRAL